MVPYILAAALAVANPEVDLDVKDESVLCIENTASDEAMYVVVGETYLTSARDYRQLTLEPGKKTCVRYDGLRNAVVTPLLLSDAERRMTSRKKRDKVDPWRKEACDYLSKGSAASFQLSINASGEIACQIDHTQADGDIRAIVKSAKPISR